MKRALILGFLLILVSLFFLVERSVPASGNFIRFFHEPSRPRRFKAFSNGTIRCIVYVDNRSGRLGNRMFTVASAYGIARLQSCHIYLIPEVLNDINGTFLADFSALALTDQEFELASKDNQSRLINVTTVETVYCYVPNLRRPGAIAQGEIYRLYGFWQSYYHFIKYYDELVHKIFAPIPAVLRQVVPLFGKTYQSFYKATPDLSSEHYEQLKEQLAELKHITWIGIHIRRTDFIGMGRVSSDQYIFEALRYYQERYPNALFLVASDDKAYCRALFRNLTRAIILPDPYSVGEDLVTLMLCQHVLVTTGTFGWWAGFLARGEVVHDGGYVAWCTSPEEYYPPWFLINTTFPVRRN